MVTRPPPGRPTPTSRPASRARRTASSSSSRSGVDQEELRATYDHVAEAYADKFLDELGHQPFDRELPAGFAERHRGQVLVLDIGCGPGHIARYLHERGIEIAGVDLSPRTIEVARRLNPELRFEIGDMAALDAEDNAL